MKKIIFIVLGVLLLVFACSDNESPLTQSELDIKKPTLSALDTWLRENYTNPYNIEVSYHWNENRVDLNRYLHPPIKDSVKVAMEAIKTIWLETYNEVAGPNFVKRIAPREILLVGGVNRNASGTVTLGLAEGGKRITFFNTNTLNIKNRPNLIRFVSTIQHEYCHIINQTVPFDEEAIRKITPSGYTAQWYETSIPDARELGFITDYARANVIEDFAEMLTTILSYNNTDYNAIIDAIKSKKAKEAIRKKEAIVASYFKTEFDIDIYELQSVAARNIERVLN
ncbi:substrate import-associated zinc metallohydrolase lipoprotein [Polaribacter porphyrae]|uniref:Substrate import-associated zinc metallohydrolase lipoprotein n=1 Tax=Polaribacter porphyrae TaxID=1137780 RepID=A0A2S7WN01_9FLAO|nr:substrate import-associated zinc metallohydrolase lipoprotein [Polaribacter porphyrae]PQJ78984.1 hypothetical protein BTO18_07255 [Polaribacter porphyrae]